MNFFAALSLSDKYFIKEHLAIFYLQTSSALGSRSVASSVGASIVCVDSP
jgi:hypothetical protein